MKGTTIVILLSSIGFIIIGLVYLRSKGIRKSFEESNIYKNTDKYIKINGLSNLILGMLGILIGIIDYFSIFTSKYIVILFIALILVQSIIHKIISKNNRNI
ncbi:hypothetical protein [Clostridium isatidis]|uniref:DUF3784 domain-containing protein n=1 Tax=Clostridium isatidis TaxID=182773 RepID=A0A343JFH5_9CLOT|nr:hypothetical protein [Clostridium isatidis]ASW44283.1 hypothetical protein BEN51_12705 [Clostridium isatidis]NLZ33538.1 hypothetical protein [Clostridiales bacterium]